MPATKNFQVKLLYLHVCLRYVQKTELNLINLKAPTPVSQVVIRRLLLLLLVGTYLDLFWTGG